MQPSWSWQRNANSFCPYNELLLLGTLPSTITQLGACQPMLATFTSPSAVSFAVVFDQFFTCVRQLRQFISLRNISYLGLLSSPSDWWNWLLLFIQTLVPQISLWCCSLDVLLQCSSCWWNFLDDPSTPCKQD